MSKDAQEKTLTLKNAKSGKAPVVSIHNKKPYEPKPKAKPKKAKANKARSQAKKKTPKEVNGNVGGSRQYEIKTIQIAAEGCIDLNIIAKTETGEFLINPDHEGYALELLQIQDVLFEVMPTRSTMQDLQDVLKEIGGIKDVRFRSGIRFSHKNKALKLARELKIPVSLEFPPSAVQKKNQKKSQNRKR